MVNLNILRVDQVGSFVRPASLRQLFERHADSQATDDQLRAAQDAAIEEIVREQEKLGLPVVGDGEFRRRTFMDSYAEVTGVDLSVGRSSDSRLAVTERIELVRNRPLEEYEFTQSLTEIPVKVTLLSANRVLQCALAGEARGVYEDDNAFLADVVEVERQIIGGLVEGGCAYVQIDGAGYTAYTDPSWIASLRGRGLDPISVLRRSAAADAASIEGHDGATFGIHFCRDNPHERWQRDGTYDGTAEVLFNSLPHDRFLLEYDGAQPDSFGTLRFVPKDKVVVLGLISTRSPTTESEDELMRRIDDATQYIDLEQLALSPQCGFSSSIGVAHCTADEQWRKLEVAMRVAERVWS